MDNLKCCTPVSNTVNLATGIVSSSIPDTGANNYTQWSTYVHDILYYPQGLKSYHASLEDCEAVRKRKMSCIT